MAKKYLDIGISTAVDTGTITASDGSALTLTNKVRLLWDDTLTKHELGVLLERLEGLTRQIEAQ